jgi:hypothetical protein
METPPSIKLVISPEVKAVLEKRRLKEDDLRKTIRHAEQTGQKFEHPHNRHFLAGLRPYFVTVWVEYSPRHDGYEVHSAYQHRVKVTGVKKP